MPWSQTPHEAVMMPAPPRLSVVLMLTSAGLNASSFLVRVLRGSIPSAFPLTARVPAGLPLEMSTVDLPRSRYSVTG
jgi:hypothetical protein